jgi:PD-(D/E)XK endonuclease
MLTAQIEYRLREAAYFSHTEPSGGGHKGKSMQALKPKQSHKAVAERGEAIIIARLLEVGYRIFMPFGDNQRCDLLIEDAAGQFWHWACQYGRLKSDGARIECATASSYFHTRAGRTAYGRKGYRGQVDFFALYCPETRGMYLIPVEQVGTTNAMLRLAPTKHRQRKHVRCAKGYQL